MRIQFRDHFLLKGKHFFTVALLSDITPIFDPVTDLDLITKFEFLPNYARFP